MLANDVYKGLLRPAILAVLFLAIVCRLFLFTYLFSTGDQGFFFQGDSYGYLLIGENLNNGNGFSLSTTSPYLPDSVRTPLFPYMIAGFLSVFESPLSIIIFQIFLSTLLVVLTYLLVLAIYPNDKVALASSLFIALEPLSIFLNLSFLTETLFTVLFIGGVYFSFLYLKRRLLADLILASVFFALAALTRPIGQFLLVILLGLVVAVFYRSWRTIAKHFFVATAVYFLILSPWLIRNYATFGTIGISSGGFQNVYSDLGATIISIRDKIPWHEAKRSLEEDFAVRHNTNTIAIQQDLSFSPLLFKEGILIMADNPIPALVSAGTVGVAFFTNDLWSYYLQKWQLLHPYEFGFSPTFSLVTDGPLITFKKIVDITGASILVPLLGRILWVLVALFFFVGLVILYRKGGMERAVALLMLAFVMYFYALSFSAGAGVNGRYRYPIYPILSVGALVGGSYVLNRLKFSFLPAKN